MKDFVIHDETYKGQWFDPSAKVLLTTSEGTSDKVVAIAKTYRKSRVVTIQLGHGPNYDDANYRKVVSEAIRWTAAGQK
jgi:type 1 glutamine amidotransferase